MIHNLLKIAFRNLWRQKISSLINILGLSIGLASSLVIFLFVYKEMNYDNFHKKGNNIYKVYQHGKVNGEESMDAWTPVPLAEAILSECPEVSNTVRLYQSDNMVITHDQKYFNIKHALYADSTFFEVFSFKIIQGNKNNALSGPCSVVLTESVAGKIFGKENPLDKTIMFENDGRLYRVKGISKDPPDNSHFEYDMLVSMDAFWDNNSDFWLRNNLNTYVMLQDGASPQDLEAKFPDMIKKYIGPQLQQVLGQSLEEFLSKDNWLKYQLQPISDIHLNASINHGLKPSGSRKSIYIFSVIGILIILIAGINFINISTSRSTLRAREAGMRTLLGSTKWKLIVQFLSESVLVSIVSLAVAVLLFGLMQPYINRITDISFSLSAFNPWMLLFMLIGLAIFIGILAGFYPAFLLSSYNSTSVLKNKLRSGRQGSKLRSILVLFQFFIAIVILSGSLVVYRQLKFLQNKDLGFDKEGVMVIGRAHALNNQSETFIEEIKKYPGVLSITGSSNIPGFSNGDNAFKVEGRSESDLFVLYTAGVDYSYISTYKMKMVQGRDFSEDLASDSAAVIINEAAVKKMGLENPVGTRLMSPDENGNYTYHNIIGVVRDFHFKSLHSAVEPFIILIRPKKSWIGYLSIRLEKGDKTRIIQQIDKSWKQFTGNKPMEYSFLDEDLKSLYKEEKKIGSLSLTFTILAIFIACLGLLGLISFTTVQRTKEIGLRKIMGASVWSIIVLLSLKTVKLIIFSSLLAWPVAYIFLKKWLEDFAFRIGLDPQIFIYSTGSILIVSLLTIGCHAFIAATRNPVDSLIYE